jgi:hypothetical protein
MAFDPSVIGNIGSQEKGDSFQKGVENAYKLADLMDERTMRGLQMRQMKQQASEQAATQGILKKYDLSDPEGRMKAVSEVTKVSPNVGMKLQGDLQKLESGELENRKAKLEIAEAQQGAIVSAIDPVIQKLDAMKAAGATQAMLDATAQKLSMDSLASLAQSNPDLKPILARFAQNPQNMTYAGLKAAEGQTKQGQALIKQHLDQFKADTQEKRELESERHNREMEGLALRRSQGEGKPPAGFEWDPDKPDTLRPISGGPKDPNSRPWSGREKVFSERIVTSANEASRAIKNITELPVGASSGVFGVGGSPGHGIFASGRDSLRNKMSTQETQDYNTMLAGVKRNLATIETTGLTPSGALTEGFASLELRSGDTQLTKLRKLAEMRQIVDAGLEVQLADPAIPDTIKNVMKHVMSSVKEAVPYTQHDVTVLQRAQEKNPDLTLETLIKNKGLNTSNSSGGKGAPQEQTATGPNGQKVVLRDGKWVPVGAPTGG